MINFTRGRGNAANLKNRTLVIGKEDVYLILSLQICRSDFQHFTISIVNFREQTLKSIVWETQQGRQGLRMPR